jgi:hypothetical protein
MEGQFEIFKEKCHNFLLTTLFCMNESFPCNLWLWEITKKVGKKIVKYGYVRGCPKKLVIQIGLLKILGVNSAQNRIHLHLHQSSEGQAKVGASNINP